MGQSNEILENPSGHYEKFLQNLGENILYFRDRNSKEIPAPLEAVCIRLLHGCLSFSIEPV